MKTKFSVFLKAAVFLAAISFALAAPENLVGFGGLVLEKVLAAGEPVMGVQVIVQQETHDKDNPGYRGARPTDDKGMAPFANMDSGTYTVSLKRFNKATSAYNVAITASGGIKKSEIWDAAKKDSFKTTVELKGNDPQSLSVVVTLADAPAAED